MNSRIQKLGDKTLKLGDYLDVTINDDFNLLIKREAEGYVFDVYTTSGYLVGSFTLWHDDIAEAQDENRREQSGED